MRNTLLLAHEIADEPAREVNPKQVHGGIGNYVRIPYPHRGLMGKQVVFEPGSDRPLNLSTFLDAAVSLTNDVARIEEADDIYKRIAPPEPEPVVIEFGEYDGALEPLVARLGPRARLRFEHPLPSRDTGRVDRSHHLFCLVHDARDAGLEPAEALALLHDAHGRWGTGKFEGREYELERMVQRAYAH